MQGFGRLAGLTIAALLAVLPGSAAADVLEVDSAGDSGMGTLRGQIAAADPGDTVLINPGVNPNLNGPEIQITKALTIQGQGAGQTAITRIGSTARIFFVSPLIVDTPVTIEGVSIAGGRAPSGAGDTAEEGEDGGAIEMSMGPGAHLILDAVELSDNRAGAGGSGVPGDNGLASPGGDGGAGGVGGGGGAIFATVGALTIRNSSFHDNFAGEGGKGGDGGDGAPGFSGGNGGGGGIGGAGGAIASSVMTEITNTTFASNHAGKGGNGGDAGDGLFPDGGIGGIGAAGGAINHNVMTPAMAIVGSTFSGNVAGPGGTGGGGVPPGGNGINGTGGGIRAGGAATLDGSIVSLNIAAGSTTSSGANCGGTDPTGSFNLIFPGGTGCPGTVANPLLGPLANNGGPTQTMALPAGSPAIDQVPVGSACPATDQRGVNRPQGAQCDVGAFEFIPPPLPLQVTATVAPPATPAGGKKCPKGKKLVRKKGKLKCKKKRKKK